LRCRKGLRADYVEKSGRARTFSLRDRSLITLAQCIALNRPNEIKVHLRSALRNRVTKTEIRELCLHLFLYCGGPASLDAFNFIKATLPEIEALERKAATKKQP
jgi:alkylhydroperoxidase/carboxymuconolactone decarboxylase family protein YurZ